MQTRPFLSRLERFSSLDSTQRVVREWVSAGDPGACIAVADKQTSGRGRQGRAWLAPPGAALLVSVGLRPARLPLRNAWRLAAIVSLAMVEAAEEVAGLPPGKVWLKWPNDLVAEGLGGDLLKVAGVLGETAAATDHVDTAVIGIGVNADWPRATFPPGLAGGMTSLRELAGGRPIDRERLLDAWLAGLEPRVRSLELGDFDAAAWAERQITTGRLVEVDLGGERVNGLATSVDEASGGLLVKSGGVERIIDSGEVIRCRVHDAPHVR